MERGRIYYRHGTTNSEALGHDVIRINDWLRSIPESTSSGTSLDDEISIILKRLSEGTESLSVILADLFKVSKDHNLDDLQNFCSLEIRGFKRGEADGNNYKYRVRPVIVAPVEIELNPYSFVQATPTSVKNEMKQNDQFFDYQMFFSEPISSVEETITANKNNPNSVCATIKMSSKKAFPGMKGKDYPVYVYIFPDVYEGLYKAVRQKAIDKIMQL